MNTHFARHLGFLGLMTLSAVSASGNDIVDFLRAINGVPEEHRGHPAMTQVSHGHDGFAGRQMTGRDHWKQATADGYGQRVAYGYRGQIPEYGHPDYHSMSMRDRAHRAHSYQGGSRTSIRVGFQSGFAEPYAQPVYIQEPVPAAPQPPVYLPPVNDVQSVPWQIGEIVDCQVPLATCVRVEDECNIAPNAVPTVVAVRDPNQCAHECHERMVFVQVCVPPCAPRSIRVSPCHTRVTMDYGDYEVDIRSKNGMIVVDYDN